MMQRVLITRSPDRSDALAKRLHAAGLEAVVVPVTVVRPLEATLHDDLNEFSVIAFSSVHGVEGFAQILARMNQPLPDTCRLASVGPATSRAIRRVWSREPLEAKGSGGEALARAILGASTSAKVLWPCASDARPEFSRLLIEAGFCVVPLVCYSTVPVELETLREALKAVAPWNVALFAAPSAVAAFQAAWPLPWPFFAVAFGGTTAKALVDAGALEVITANATDEDALLSAIRHCATLEQVRT